MEGVNSVTLIGNVGVIGEITNLENGKKILNITIATPTSHFNIAKQKRTEVEWHDVVLWNYLAELGTKHLQKGSTVYIEGRIKYRNKNSEKQAEIICKTIRIFGKEVINNECVVEVEGFSEDTI